MIDFKSIDRYSRQMRFHGVGEEGQRKLLASKVTLCGCGALGTVLANNLARAGVGSIKVVDRDFIEPSNLQRQVLFDENDVTENNGMTMTIIPNQTPCLRCVFEAAPSPGSADTCETAGVLGPVVNIIASMQATEAIKILSGKPETINKELVQIDVWENTYRRVKIAPLLGKVDCPCCKHRKFEWIDGEFGSQTTSLCGRNAVQISNRTPNKLKFEDMAAQLKTLGDVSFNKFMLKFNAEDCEFTVFPDGRAIIKGTSDIDRAKTLYARYIGH